MKRTVALVILDGWGIGREDHSNPIHVAKPEHLGWLGSNFPLTSLQASGISVGLPWGEVGNSEVGHLTLGAGKVIYQHFPLITLAIREGRFFENPALKAAFAHARTNRSSVNLVGLATDANIHASLDHLEALLNMAKREGIDRIKLHLFTDGKDSPPRSLETFLRRLPKEKLASLSGRYYALDRDENWNLIRQVYDTMTGEAAPLRRDPLEALREIFTQGLSEEFLPPTRVAERLAIEDHDAIIFFNFREDGMREIVSPFLLKDFDKFPVRPFKNLYIATMTRYGERFPAPVAFEPDVVHTPLGRVLSEAGKNQLRVAETYKYAHVTYFFNGYQEAPYQNEYRVLIPSLTTPHIEEHPGMMASAITDRVVQALENQAFDFILVNYANPDSIAHTGNYDAALEAVRVIDAEIGKLLKVGLNQNTAILITSDHGNIERIMNPMTAEAETQHDPNPVPFYLVASEFRGRQFINYGNVSGETVGILSDVAPTILDLLGIEKSSEMQGETLLKKLRT